MSKQKKVKVWWLRKGGEAFLTSNLWMNGDNARLYARGHNQNRPQDNYKVIPCTLTYKV